MKHHAKQHLNKENISKFKYFLQIAVSMCAVMGWWGFLYPEFTLTSDTVKVITDSDTETSLSEDTSVSVRDDACPDLDSALYRELLTADRSQIVFRSKLLTNLNLFWEALQNGDK